MIGQARRKWVRQEQQLLVRRPQTQNHAFCRTNHPFIWGRKQAQFKKHCTCRSNRRWTKLLTYSMVQSPSWEANWFAASQEIPRILWNPKVHYRTHKRPPPVPILGRPNPVHIPTSHLLEIHPNIIHPSTPRSPQWSLSLRFPYQDPIHPLSSPIRATCPAHLILDFTWILFHI